MDVKIIGYFDGSFRENRIGIAAWHYKILYNDMPIHKSSGYVTKKSRKISANKMEFRALLELLKDIKIHNQYLNLNEIIIRGDSSVVVEQLRIESESFRKEKCKINNELQEFTIPLKIEWIPRKYNKVADELCRKAYKSLVI